MTQSSGPIASGTTSERQMTDTLWRDLFGDESGVVGDMDGSAYKLTLPSSSDIASVGSSTQASLARVAGFAHRIPSGSPEPLTIPVAVGSARTDIIALRYDPAFTGALGPVRLTRIAGASAAIPTYDAAPPGVEDLPLWAITRQPSQGLSQATIVQMFPRIAPALDLPAGAQLPLNSPLGTVIWQGGQMYRRVLDSSQAAVWATTQNPRVRTVLRAYGSGAVALPGQSFVDIDAMTLTVNPGQLLRVEVTQNVRVDGSAVQTALPNLGASGGTVTASHAMSTRFPPTTADHFEDQLYRSYLVTATGSTVILKPSLTCGTGVPRLVMSDAALTVTLVEPF